MSMKIQETNNELFFFSVKSKEIIKKTVKSMQLHRQSEEIYTFHEFIIDFVNAYWFSSFSFNRIKHTKKVLKPKRYDSNRNRIIFLIHI